VFETGKDQAVEYIASSTGRFARASGGTIAFLWIWLFGLQSLSSSGQRQWYSIGQQVSSKGRAGRVDGEE